MIARKVFKVSKVVDDVFDIEWKNQLEKAIIAPEFPNDGPLWRLCKHLY